MEKQILSRKITQTHIHASLKIPAILDLKVDITKKSQKDFCCFFDAKKSVEMQALIDSKHDIPTLETKF